MSDIFQEVDEEIRQEKLEQFWKENGAFIIAMIVAVIIGTGAIAFYKDYKLGKNEAQTASLIEASRESEPDQLVSAAAGMDDKHGALARLTAAGLMLDRGEQEQAIKVYDEVILSSKIEPLYRDLAVLMASTLRFENGDADLARLKGQILPLTQENNPWRFSALELEALIAAEQGDYELAIRTLERVLKDKNAPRSLAGRAEALTQLYKTKLSGAPKGTE